MNQKSNIYKLITLLFLGLLIGCEDPYKYSPQGEALTTASLIGPENNQNLVLNSGTPNDYVIFSWNAAKSGLDGEVSYEVVLDKVGGDFSAPLLAKASVGEGKKNYATITHQELNEALKKTGANELSWSVKASNGSRVLLYEGAFIIKATTFGEGISSIKYLSPEPNKKVFIDTIRTPESKEKFVWTSAKSTTGKPVTYKWLASTSPDNFSNPVLSFNSENGGKDTTLTLAKKQLMKALSKVSYKDGLYWKVEASTGDFKYSPSAQFIWFDIFNITQLYVLGDATTAGWNNDATSPIALNPTGPAEFNVILNLEGGKNIKFILTRGSWTDNWGSKAGVTVESDKEYELVAGGENIIVPETSTYAVEVSFIKNTFKISKKLDAVYMLGDATEAGWDANSTVALVRDKSNGLEFSYTGKLKAGYLKFINKRNRWAPMWGKGNTDGKLQYRASDSDPDPASIQISADGYYKIDFDAGALTYSVTPYNVAGKPTYTTVGLIGDATPSGWGASTALTQSAFDPHQWYVDGITLTSGSAKFRADNDWAVNWGSGDFPYGSGVQNGANVDVSAGKYLVRFNDLTGDYSFIKQP